MSDNTKHPRVKDLRNCGFKKKPSFNNGTFKTLIYKKSKEKMLIYIYKMMRARLSVVKLFKHMILKGLLLPRTYFTPLSSNITRFSNKGICSLPFAPTHEDHAFSKLFTLMTML